MFARLANERGWKRAVVATSGEHLARARFVASQCTGADVLPVPPPTTRLPGGGRYGRSSCERREPPQFSARSGERNRLMIGEPAGLALLPPGVVAFGWPLVSWCRIVSIGCVSARTRLTSVFGTW